MGHYIDTDSHLKNPLAVVPATGIEIRVPLSTRHGVANSDDRSRHDGPIAVCLLWIDQSPSERALFSSQS